MEREIVIDVRNLRKTYKLFKRNSDRIRETFHPFRKKYHHPFDAIKDLSFQVHKGESIGIIGRNGSGKSTLLQILCNILQPTSGSVTVNGRISALLELGAGFNPEFTGRENVFLSTAIMGLSHQEVASRFDAITDFAEIGEFIDQPVKLYSSGMYVRLAFATAISIEPELLIVDEALAVGDIFFQQKCIARMKEMLSNCTIVFVTHDMHAVANLCERVIVIDGGMKLFEGSPLEGISTYTKIVHNERYQRLDRERPQATIQAEIPAHHSSKAAWTIVPAEARGGALEIEILQARLIGDDHEVKETVQAGERCVIQMIVEAKKDKENVIFGYTLKDRIGNAIFGENTCSSLRDRYTLTEGRHLIKLVFAWPEIYPATYIFTLGVGEGNDPFVHTIHCWAHNILSISALTPGKGVHGIFNNPILECCVDPEN